MGSCDRFKKYHTAKLFNECEAAKVCHRTKRDALPEFSPMEHEALLEPSEFETRDALPGKMQSLRLNVIQRLNRGLTLVQTR